MNETLAELSNRIQKIEIHLSQISNNKNVLTQISNLQRKLEQVYLDHPGFKQLNSIINELRIWDKIRPEPEPEDQCQEVRDGLEMTDEMKKELLVLNADQINLNYSLGSELINMEIDSILKGINSKVMQSDKETPLLLSTLLARESEVRHLIRLVQIVTVKNMIVYEEYMKLILKENQFWIDMDERITKLNARVNLIQLKKESSSKY